MRGRLWWPFGILLTACGTPAEVDVWSTSDGETPAPETSYEPIPSPAPVAPTAPPNPSWVASSVELPAPVSSAGAAALALADSVDVDVLARSIEQLASLTVRSQGRELFRRTREQILPYVPDTALHLTSTELEHHWFSTVRAWLYQVSSSPTADAQSVLKVLASYFVGIHQVSIGPECGPISGSYVYGFASSGMPGDMVFAQVQAEVARSEAHIQREIAQFATSCITAVRASPSGSAVIQDVIIDLPADPSQPVGDMHVRGPDGRRVGVPVPAPTPRHSSKLLR